MKKLFLLIGLTLTLGNISAMNNGMQAPDDAKKTLVHSDEPSHAKNPKGSTGHSIMHNFKTFCNACDNRDLKRLKKLFKKSAIKESDLLVAEDETVKEFLALTWEFLYQTKTVIKLVQVLREKKFN